MNLKISKYDEISIIDIKGKMDYYNSYKLKELIVKMLEEKVEKIIISMENVDDIDSSGIGVLIHICSTIRKMNLQLIFCHIHGTVKEIIELTKLTGYFPIEVNIEKAILKIARDY